MSKQIGVTLYLRTSYCHWLYRLTFNVTATFVICFQAELVKHCLSILLCNKLCTCINSLMHILQVHTLFKSLIEDFEVFLFVFFLLQIPMECLLLPRVFWYLHFYIYSVWDFRFFLISINISIQLSVISSFESSCAWCRILNMFCKWQIFRFSFAVPMWLRK